ncbi:MAG: PEP-CTERM sorting domain-containing protein, partial [Sedimentisphaerales bacterium]|nr:PEP-CTERM sorting domain-containing protein [Sedimentisphaerales bacterium]
WQYTYEVTNNSLSVPIEEFTVWFDYDLYANLAVETPTTPPHWDQLVLQPEPVLPDDGAFDAAKEALGGGIEIGRTLGGFAVSFDWLGIGEPGPQPYDIIDPQTFQTIDSGITVIPEPATLLLLAAGGLTLLRKHRTPR